MFDEHQQDLIITLRKLLVTDPDLEDRRIKFQLYDGRKTLQIAHQKVIKNSCVRFYGQSFTIALHPPVLFFVIQYQIQKEQWRQLVLIKVSEKQISEFSKKKNVYASQQNNITVIWEAQINGDQQIKRSATFSLGKRNFQDFSDEELYLSPKKNQNRPQIYSPIETRQTLIFQKTIKLKRQDTLSQRKSDSGRNKLFTLNTNDTFLATNKQNNCRQKNEKEKLEPNRIKMSAQGAQNTSVNQKRNIKSPPKIKIRNQKEDLATQNLASKKQSKQAFSAGLNKRIDLQFILSVSFFGLIGGIAGALISNY